MIHGRVTSICQVRVLPRTTAPVVGILELGQVVEALQWDGSFVVSLF